VSFEGAHSEEGVAADFAFKWSCITMPALVILQVTLGCEASTAPRVVTIEGSLPSVYSHVDLDIALLGKTLVANGAVKWLLARVRALVDFETG